MPKLAIGDTAPDFTAAGTGGREYRLSDYLGKPVVLVFYPGDATPVCTIQLRSYNSGIEQFAELEAVVLGISPQDVESHEKWAAKEEFTFPLLYDEGKKLGEAFDVLGPLGFYRRSVFVIDAAGKVTYAKRNINNALFVKTENLVEAVKQARASA